MANARTVKVKIDRETLERYADELVDLAVNRWVNDRTNSRKIKVLGEVEGYKIVAISTKRRKAAKKKGSSKR